MCKVLNLYSSNFEFFLLSILTWFCVFRVFGRMTYFASLFSMVDQDINTEMIILIVNTKIHMIKLRLLKSLKVSWPKKSHPLCHSMVCGVQFWYLFYKRSCFKWHRSHCENAQNVIFYGLFITIILRTHLSATPTVDNMYVMF